ncbi:MAG: SRPBCC family protein [Bacteroidetes bacterium]|nr:SRPBCC family protein [Bacteroidota bacterium]
MEKVNITVATTVNAPVEKVWDCFNAPHHIVKWGSPSPDWHTTKAENDIRTGGNFLYRMEAKDGSFGFDFGGVYDSVIPNEHIAYTMGDGRKVDIRFTQNGNAVTLTETFEAENENPIEQQQTGWQAILDNFKAYTEN